MANLKDLQEMVKSGEFSKKLLEDEEFKTKIKKILKEESGVEITDEDIPEFVEELAKSLTEKPNDSQVKQTLSETTLENVSGGVSKAKIIKTFATLAGYVLGERTSNKYLSKLDSEGLKVYKGAQKAINSDRTLPPEEKPSRHAELLNKYYKNNPEILLEAFGKDVGAIATGVATGYASNKLADYLCKKFNIK